MPKVSIIIPAYNVESFIEDCVMSVLNQTEKDIEIIVVDDGSTDNTPLILERLSESDNRIVVISQQNHGQSMARNIGIEAANSDYLFFIDADDTLRSIAIETMYNCAIDTKSDVVVCSYDNIHTYKNKSYRRRVSQNVNNSFRGDFFINLLQQELFHSVWNKLYKKDVFDNVKFKDIMPGEDAVLNLEIARLGRSFYYIDIPLYNYFSRAADSSISTYKPNIKESIDLIYSGWKALLDENKVEIYSSNEFLDRMSFERYLACLKNIYKRNTPYTFVERTKYIRENLLNDDESRIVVNTAHFKRASGEILFSLLYKINNATLINSVYTVLWKLYTSFRPILA